MSITRRGAVSAAGALLAGFTPFAAAAQTAAFASGGASITVERFDAAGGGARPAVILLHGADGLTFGERYRTVARLLAGTGYHVFLIHYLDRTGESRANYSTIGRNLGAWVDTLRDGIAYVAGQPGVIANRIGLVGISLGAAIALSTGAQDRRVKVVIDFFGPFFEGVARRIGRVPPTLVLHGDQDGIVPVENARAIERYLKANNIPHEVVIYPGQGHGFSGAAQIDSAQRSAAFLARYLGGSGRAEAEPAAAAAG